MSRVGGVVGVVNNDDNNNNNNNNDNNNNNKNGVIWMLVSDVQDSCLDVARY